MGELSLMASAAFTPGIFHQDQALVRPPKDLQALLPGQFKRQDICRSGCVQIGAPHAEDPWQLTSLLPESNNTQLFTGDSFMKKHAFIDVQDTRPESVLFSYGVAEQCRRHEKVLKFLASGSSIADEKDLDISLISDLMGFHTVSHDVCPQPQAPMDEFCLCDVGMDDPCQVIHPQRQLYASRSLLDFVGNVSHTSAITVHPNGHVLFSGNGSEMKDLLSIVEEFNLSKNLSNGSKKAMVVPYFTRKRGYAQTKTQESFLKLDTITVAPSKSSGNSKLKPMPKKKQNRKLGMERNMYSKNYFHACESLLDVYLDKQGDRRLILSLKNSSPELAEVLHQFSAGIAGTGLAVFLAIACKSVNGRALALSSTKLLNISFGFGLLWLSWAVNKLRDNINCFSKRSNRTKKPDGEVAITREVVRSVNEILFRAAALMAMAVLRLG